jgi:hypothetical protein
MTRDRLLRRLTIFGAVVGAFVLIDGLVLFFTHGLSTDATPVLPVLGGSFAKTRSSGVSVIILGVVLVALTLTGRWWLGRRLRPDAGDAAAVEAPDAPASAEQPAAMNGRTDTAGASMRPANGLRTDGTARPAGLVTPAPPRGTTEVR